MLDLDLRSEARALLQYEQDGDDPEVVAQQWIDANMAEFLTVTHEARALIGITRSKWFDDTIAAHKWLRRNQAHRCRACSAVCYNDCGVSFDPITNKPHTCKEI